MKKKIVIGILEQAVRANFHVDLVRSLKERFDVDCHIYSYTENGLSFYRKYSEELFCGLHIVDMKSSVILTSKEVHEKIEIFEDRYGIPFGWFKVTDREHGLGYSPGGYFHPKSKSDVGVSDEYVLSKYIKKLEYWEREFKKQRFDLFLNGFFFEYFPACANNIPIRTALAARNENYYFWAHNCYGEMEGLSESFSTLPSPKRELYLDDAPVLNRKQLDVMIHRARTSVAINRAFRLIYKWLYRQYKSTGKSYYLLSELKLVYREWKVLRYLYRQNLPNSSDIRGGKYIFYALQVEPELNFQGYSPECFCQLNVILSLSRDLPADTKLVVKEHIPAAAKRPPGFYDQIRRLKNVTFVDPRDSGLNYVKGAVAVATINGTVGQEAAILGKPVIAFGRRNLYNFLPHVKLVSNDDQLPQVLRWATDSKFDGVQASIDGQKYLSALQSKSFPMEDFGYHNPRGYTPETIEISVDKLLESLAISDRKSQAIHN